MSYIIPKLMYQGKRYVRMNRQYLHEPCAQAFIETWRPNFATYASMHVIFMTTSNLVDSDVQPVDQWISCVKPHAKS